MKEKFQDVLRRELKTEFEKQMNLQVNDNELKKVIKEYQRIKRSPIHEIKEMDKKSKKT
jgi:hypothetical protein